MHVVQVSNAGVYTTPQSCGASGLSKMLSSVGGFPHVVELGVQNGVDMPRSVGSHGGECEDIEGKNIFQNQGDVTDVRTLSGLCAGVERERNVQRATSNADWS